MSGARASRGNTNASLRSWAWAWRRWPVAVAPVFFMATAHAQTMAARPVVCRQAGVEMIVGGVPPPIACSGPGLDIGNKGLATGRPAGHAKPEPAAFDMRVAAATQQAREDERHRILQRELAQEELQLVAYQRAPALDTEAAERSQENIAALRREIQRQASIASAGHGSLP